MDYSKVYKSIEASVVHVVYKGDNVSSSGTGAVINDGKMVLTCSHCCNSDCKTGIYNNRTFIEGAIIFDNSEEDIAILEFKEKLGEPLKIIDSEYLEIGNEVFTVGYPLNKDKTLIAGHVAGFEDGLIKIDSSINNGNSGGPLFNINGEIIGVINAKVGALTPYLREIQNKNVQIGKGVFINGVNFIEAEQEKIKAMRERTNVGIGYAIPTHKIKTVSEIINRIISA